MTSTRIKGCLSRTENSLLHYSSRSNVIMSFLKSPRILKRMANFYLPFWANGISVVHVSNDMMKVDVRLRLSRRSTNAVGTMFGGSLFTFCDPFYMIILLKQIGKQHLVWDKSTFIEFVSPGRTEINHSFYFTQSEIQDIVDKCKSGKPYLVNKEFELKENNGNVVARVHKVIYVRKKNSN